MKTRQTDITYIPDADGQPQHEYLHTIRHNISEYNPTPESTTRKRNTCIIRQLPYFTPAVGPSLQVTAVSEAIRNVTLPSLNMTTDRSLDHSQTACYHQSVHTSASSAMSKSQPQHFIFMQHLSSIIQYKYTKLSLLLKMRQDKSYTARMQLQTRLL